MSLKKAEYTNIVTTDYYPDGYMSTLTSSSISGTIGLMCPKCFRVIYMIVNSFLTDSSHPEHKDDTNTIIPSIRYDYHCPNCGEYRTMITLDPNIAEVIGILNRKGYHTVSCCEGHDDNDAYIEFLQHYEFPTVPVGWIYNSDSHYLRETHGTIGKRMNISGRIPFTKENYMNNLRIWALSL